jgi:hypothetical protein
MTFEQVWPLLPDRSTSAGGDISFLSKRRRDRLAINIFGTLLLLAFCLPGFVPRKSSVAAEALAQALTGLSDTDLKRGTGRFSVIETKAGARPNKRRRSNLTM